MPIPKITATQFQTNLRDAIDDRTTSYDTALGPIPDVIINPAALVFESQNDRIRTVSLIISLANEIAFSGDFEADLDAYVFNEGVLRISGSRATATVVFSRGTAPSSDLVVQRGYPIGTSPDESTGQTITFITTQSATLPAASASSYFNIQTQRYELSVPVVAVVQGESGRVGQNRINRPLRPLVGFDSVTNPAEAEGGLGPETNSELIARYLLAILGRRLSTPTGVSKAALDNFPDVEDILTVYGTNPLLLRASDDQGAVDAYIVGAQALEVSENIEFFGVGQLLQVAEPPLIGVTSVSSGANTYIQDQDFEVVFDETNNAGSVRAIEGIQFLAGGPTTLPAVSDVVTISYTKNQLIRNLQDESETDDFFTFGRDLLYKEGLEVGVAIEGTLRVETGFSFTTVLAAVQTTILSFVNALKLGEDVERSDIQGVVRLISGVDNLVFTRFTRLTVLSGVDDIPVGDNEYARMDSADLSIVSG